MTLTLEARDVVKAFAEGETVLHGVTLTLAPATVTAVAGGVGDGKTTLLRCLAGAYRVDAGSVRVRTGDEEVVLSDADARTVAWLRRRHVGLVDGRLVAAPREPAALAAARVLEHAGVPAAEALDEVSHMLAAFGLERLAQVPVGLLPVHARRAVAIAGSLLRPPAVVLLDEPVRGLADHAARHVTALVERAREAGAAVLVAVRPGDELAGRADRLLQLDQGALT